ncbi:hypothetical protein M430DRAFT_31258 [Amorphotheca resinae ATCC 22711]|uniref:Uncharacterized protein n=1 Tax=Amorphotheca resinae ATCC 22711 TaxID=857342 RepID=A0A2T3AQK8_AMORE|nr:hypothetical protein M430DRAFT_31258 [Amorphotheca resinae ATCC 22711]PSS08536.1 hypothetical protein M430DRAFT_31258 [Amorphotheca resinae ATCC 22711]
MCPLQPSLPSLLLLALCHRSHRWPSRPGPDGAKHVASFRAGAPEASKGRSLEGFVHGRWDPYTNSGVWTPGKDGGQASDSCSSDLQSGSSARSALQTRSEALPDSALRPEVVSVPRESVVVLPFGVSQTQELLLYSEQTRDFPRPERPRSDQSRRPIATGLEDGGEERKKG